MAFGLGRSQYQLGLTKVFFRPGKQEFLDSIFRRSQEKLTPELERSIRQWMIRRRNQRAVWTVRVFVHWKRRLEHIRNAHNFRRVGRLVRPAAQRSQAGATSLTCARRVPQAVTYVRTLHHALDRVRRLQGARTNAVGYIQEWFRQTHFRQCVPRRAAPRRRCRPALTAPRAARTVKAALDARVKAKAKKRFAMVTPCAPRPRPRLLSCGHRAGRH